MAVGPELPGSRSGAMCGGPALIYLVSHETVENEPLLQRHFDERYQAQVRAREEARKAANTARRAAQKRREAVKRAAIAPPEDSSDGRRA